MIGQSSIFLTAIVALLTQVPTATAQSTCQNPTQFTQCMQSFFGNLGFSGFPYNDTVFAITLHNYVLQNDIAGWNNLRSWMMTLQTCAGGMDNFNACGDWHNLMNTFHISQQEAINYEIQFAVLQYETGPAFNVLTHNWFCIKAVDQQEGPVVQACRQHYSDQQQQHPELACQNLGEYLNCVERPYVTHCGRDVAAVVCNVEKIIYKILRPDCNDSVALHCNGAFNPFKNLAKKFIQGTVN